MFSENPFHALFTASCSTPALLSIVENANRRYQQFGFGRIFFVNCRERGGSAKSVAVFDTHSRKLLLFLSLLSLSTLIGAADTPPCSRERSSQARTVINKVLMPLYNVKHMDVPTSCPLSPANDQFAAEEAMKRRLGNKWMCSVCGKQFGGEKELESHISHSHAPSNRVEGCLADQCDILRCDAYFTVNFGEVKCDESEMRIWKDRCMNMVRDLCIPDYLDETRKLNFEAAVQASICTYLTCDNYWTVPEEDPDMYYSNYYITYAALVGVLFVFLFVYFKIASDNIDQSLSIEQVLAAAEQLDQAHRPVVAPVSPDMEMRRRAPRDTREWAEHE